MCQSPWACMQTQKCTVETPVGPAEEAIGSPWHFSLSFRLWEYWSGRPQKAALRALAEKNECKRTLKPSPPIGCSVSLVDHPLLPWFFFQGTALWQQPAGACSCPFLLEHSSTSAAWMEWLSSRLRTLDQILISVRHPTTSLVLITYSLHPWCIPKRHLTPKGTCFLEAPFVEPENHHWKSFNPPQFGDPPTNRRLIRHYKSGCWWLMSRY